MADNEVISHCELLMYTGDIHSENGSGYLSHGTNNYITFVNDLSKV